MVVEPADVRHRVDSIIADRRAARRFLWIPYAAAGVLLCTEVIAPKLTLIYLYGWHRVWQEHLKIVGPLTPHVPHKRLLSNGDVIDNRDTGFFLPLSMLAWFALGAAAWAVTTLVARRRRVS